MSHDNRALAIDVDEVRRREDGLGYDTWNMGGMVQALVA
jgi:hypothetical protein